MLAKILTVEAFFIHVFFNLSHQKMGMNWKEVSKFDGSVLSLRSTECLLTVRHCTGYFMISVNVHTF